MIVGGTDTVTNILLCKTVSQWLEIIVFQSSVALNTMGKRGDLEVERRPDRPQNKRSCTDVLCLALFTVFIGGWVGDPQSPKPTIAQFFWGNCSIFFFKNTPLRISSFGNPRSQKRNYSSLFYIKLNVPCSQKYSFSDFVITCNWT